MQTRMSNIAMIVPDAMQVHALGRGIAPPRLLLGAGRPYYGRSITRFVPGGATGPC